MAHFRLQHSVEGDDLLVEFFHVADKSLEATCLVEKSGLDESTSSMSSASNRIEDEAGEEQLQHGDTSKSDALDITGHALFSSVKSNLKTKQTDDAAYSYHTELMDDGSELFICSHCNLVFFKMQALSEHKCAAKSTANTAMSNGHIDNTDPAVTVDNKLNGENLVVNGINGEKHLNGGMSAEHMVMHDDDDDDDNIYME